MRLVQFLQRCNLLTVQIHLQGFDRFIKMMRFSCPNDRSSDARLVQHPSQCDLCVGYASLVSDLSDPVNNREIRVLVIKAMRKLIGSSAGGLTLFLAIAISGQKPSRQRAPRNNAKPFLATERNHFSFLLSINQVVMILHRHEARITMSFRCTKKFSELPGAHAGSADVEGFALVHDLR